MADETRNNAQIEAADQIRSTLAEAMAFVRGQEKIQAISSVSYEEFLDQAISFLSEDESELRPSLLSRITQLKEKVGAAIDRALEMPAEAFQLVSSENVANTSLSGTAIAGNTDD